MKKGKSLRATVVAGELMDLLPLPLKDPGMTALWEQALDDIAEGKMSLDDFMVKQSSWTAQLVEKGRQQAIRLTVAPSRLARYVAVQCGRERVSPVPSGAACVIRNVREW